MDYYNARAFVMAGFAMSPSVACILWFWAGSGSNILVPGKWGGRARNLTKIKHETCKKRKERTFFTLSSLYVQHERVLEPRFSTVTYGFVAQCISPTVLKCYESVYSKLPSHGDGGVNFDLGRVCVICAQLTSVE